MTASVKRVMQYYVFSTQSVVTRTVVGSGGQSQTSTRLGGLSPVADNGGNLWVPVTPGQ